jgi:hypothetical protein
VEFSHENASSLGGEIVLCETLLDFSVEVVEGATEGDDLGSVAREDGGQSRALEAAPTREDCDTWLLDATHYVIGLRWLAPGESVGCTSTKAKMHPTAVKALEEIREMAGNGRLYVEGSVATGYLPAAIAPAHWIDHRVSLESFLAGSREQMRTERLPDSDDRTSYLALKVSRQQVEELWPPNS